MIKILIFLVVSFSAAAEYYYPDKTFTLVDDELKEILFKEISKKHKSQSYKGARRAIFNKLFL